MKRLIATVVLLTIALTSVVAYARRTNPLEGQPAVRRRVLYLDKRFEVAPQIGLTFLQDFKHYFLVGLKAEYHIMTWLSVGVFFDYAAFGWDTELTNEIEDTLPNEVNVNTDVDPSPSKSIMKKAISDIMFKAGVYVAYTPWFGKLSLFGKVFANFDLHILAGAGFVYLKKGDLVVGQDIDPTGTQSRMLHMIIEKDNGGFKVGPLFGFGLHFHILKWLSLSLTFHAIIIKRNAAGFDKNGDTLATAPNVVRVNEKDESWENVMSFTLGVSFFFPTSAKRTK